MQCILAHLVNSHGNKSQTWWWTLGKEIFAKKTLGESPQLWWSYWEKTHDLKTLSYFIFTCTMISAWFVSYHNRGTPDIVCISLLVFCCCFFGLKRFTFITVSCFRCSQVKLTEFRSLWVPFVHYSLICLYLLIWFVVMIMWDPPALCTNPHVFSFKSDNQCNQKIQLTFVELTVVTFHPPVADMLRTA